MDTVELRMMFTTAVMDILALKLTTLKETLQAMYIQLTPDNGKH